MMGWDKGTENILKFTNKDGKTISLIAKYGQIDAGTLCKECENFIQAKGINSTSNQPKTMNKCGTVVQHPHQRGQNNTFVLLKGLQHGSQWRSQGGGSLHV